MAEQAAPPTSMLQNPIPDAPSPKVADVQLPSSTSSTLGLTQAPAPESGEASAPGPANEPAPATAPAPAEAPQSVNGVALATAATAVAAAAAQSAVSSPVPRPDTPQQSTPKAATPVNGHVAPPPPAHTPGTSVFLAASVLSTPLSGGAGARSKEQLRWRDPITVKYDGGQAQPGKLQPSQPSPQPAVNLKQQHQPQSQPPAVQHLQSQPQPQQYPTPPHTSSSQPLPQPSLHVQAHQQQQQQQPHHNLHPHSQAQQHPQHQPQYIQHQPQHSHPQPYPHQQPPHVHPQHKHPLHPPPPQQVTATALPPLHHQHPSHLPPQHLPSGRPLSTISRPIIMDPPSSRNSTPKGFPSPTLDHVRVNSKFVDDCTRITYAVQQSVPEAVRRIVRDHWEKCLLGSEFHQAFILNASIHHALPSITRRAVRDFGEKMVRESKDELMIHFRTEDLDEVADAIIEKASDSFLDKCLAKRLQTIEAKPLINALAKAERLGYEAGDIVEGDQHENVIPQEAFPGAAAASGTNGLAQSRPAQHPPQGQPQPYPTHHQLQCMVCYRTFTQHSAYEHHTRYKVCAQAAPTSKGFEHSCSYCGQGFTRLDELQIHLENRICTTPSGKTSRGPGRPARSAPAPQPNPVAILPSSQSPGPNGYPSSYIQSTPTHHSTGGRPSMGTPNSAAASPNPADPYAHLTPESLNRMNQELLDAETKYAPRFAEAEAIVDENERRARIEGLRNSFGTKQSMIRKKYGVRLRERRTKAEIAAERERLGLKRAEREKAKAILAKQALAANASAQQQQASAAAAGTGWTAANTPQAAQDIWDDHDAKRRRLDGTGGYQTPHKSAGDETPTRKTLSVSQLGGGLSGTPATAETQDPTLAAQPAQDSQPQSPSNGENHAGNPISISDNASRRSSLQRSTASPLPENTTQPDDDMDVDSDSSDDDQDIPSTLPAHVRSSLAAQPHGLHS